MTLINIQIGDSGLSFFFSVFFFSLCDFLGLGGCVACTAFIIGKDRKPRKDID